LTKGLFTPEVGEFQFPTTLNRNGGRRENRGGNNQELLRSKREGDQVR